jgi:hypothetical protein
MTRTEYCREIEGNAKRTNVTTDIEVRRAVLQGLAAMPSWHCSMLHDSFDAA